MSKSSVRYVHQMAIYMVCDIFFFFLNSPSELTFWIILVHCLQLAASACVKQHLAVGSKTVEKKQPNQTGTNTWT